MSSSKARLVVLCGPPCCGKSEISQELAGTGILQLEMDRIREVLFPEGANTPEERRVSYAAMHFCAERLLEKQVSPICVVATYQPPQQRLAVTRLAENVKSDLLVVQLKVDPDDAMRRFLGRPDGHPAKDLTPARVRELAVKYRYYHQGITIDTSRLSLAKTLQLVIEAVNEASPGRSLSSRLFSEWIALAQEQ